MGNRGSKTWNAEIGKKASALFIFGGVGGGCFSFILLLGISSGLTIQLKDEFKDDALNSVWIYPRATSLPFQGYDSDRKIEFNNADIKLLTSNVPEIERISARYFLADQVEISYRDKAVNFVVRAVHPDHKHIELTQVNDWAFY